MAEPALRHANPVTAVFTWAVAPGRDRDFEEWLTDVDRLASTFPGQEGVTWLRPDDESRRYYAILRFSDSSSLGTWTDSPQRAEQIRKLGGIATEAEPRLTTTGLETWFSLPHQVVQPPARWKMTLITLLAVYPPVLLFEWLTHDWFTTWPLPLRTLVLPVVLSPLLTYAILPVLSRVFRRFLYTDRSSRDIDTPTRNR